MTRFILAFLVAAAMMVGLEGCKKGKQEQSQTVASAPAPTDSAPVIRHKPKVTQTTTVTRKTERLVPVYQPESHIETSTSTVAIDSQGNVSNAPALHQPTIVDTSAPATVNPALTGATPPPVPAPPQQLKQ